MLEIGKTRQVRVRRRVNKKLVYTDETKIVAREIWAQTKDELGGHFGPDRHRRLVVGLVAGDVLVLYPKGTRQQVTVQLKDVYGWAVRSKALRTQLEKARERKAKLAEQREARRRDAAERRLRDQARKDRNAQ
jgi:hypothetical protein